MNDEERRDQLQRFGFAAVERVEIANALRVDQFRDRIVVSE